MIELKDFRVFADLKKDDLEKLASMIRHIDYGADELIFMEGAPAFGFYLVFSGAVKVVKRSAKGKSQILKIVGPGGMLGETTLFDKTVHNAYAKTLVPSKVGFIERGDFFYFLERHPKVIFRFFERLSLELKAFQNKLAERSYASSKERLPPSPWGSWGSSSPGGSSPRWPGSRPRPPSGRWGSSSHAASSPSRTARSGSSRRITSSAWWNPSPCPSTVPPSSEVSDKILRAAVIGVLAPVSAPPQIVPGDVNGAETAVGDSVGFLCLLHGPRPLSAPPPEPGDDHRRLCAGHRGVRGVRVAVGGTGGRARRGRLRAPVGGDGTGAPHRGRSPLLRGGAPGGRGATDVPPILRGR
ncbi:MAG: Crp/Fnr family transcriptional regulator [Caldiserica bacterium]|nr:Crp/Fnr family transcriptional regulator [Caldisericota bacterium]